MQFVDMIRIALYQNLKGFYAGICILSLLLFPALDSSFPNMNPIVPGINVTVPYMLPITFTELNRPVGPGNSLIPFAAVMDLSANLSSDAYKMKYNTSFSQYNSLLYNTSRKTMTVAQADTFLFVGWYSNISMRGNYVFQLAGTVCMVGALDHASSPAHYFTPTKIGLDRRTALRGFFVAAMAMSYICSILIIPIDYALMNSQTILGAKYGMPFWQYNQTGLSDPIFLNDMIQFRQLNLWRGIGGIAHWVVSFFIWSEIKQQKIIPM